MGITYAEGVLTGPTGKQATVLFLFDSGATYSLVLQDIWKALDLTPKRTVTFSLADGTAISRAVSECHIALPQGDGHTSVIPGRAGRRGPFRNGYPGNSGVGAASVQAHARADAHAAGVIGIVAKHHSAGWRPQPK